DRLFTWSPENERRHSCSRGHTDCHGWLVGGGVMMDSTTRVSQALERLKGMFLDVPGTRLSIDEASRLSGFDETTCSAIVKALEDARFLKRQRDGVFTRASD